MKVPELSHRERMTVLAALREWQGILEGQKPPEGQVEAIATNEGQFALLSSKEIDELCERLNRGGP
jgi:hypothetical protein